MFEECTNEDRAEFAEAALREFRDGCSGSPLTDKDGYAEAIGDLIGNLCHLAVQHNLDPFTLIKHGVSHYVVESIENDGMAFVADVSLDVRARRYRGGSEYQPYTKENVRKWRRELKKELAPRLIPRG
jgi:hypothetical protein